MTYLIIMLASAQANPKLEVHKGTTKTCSASMRSAATVPSSGVKRATGSSAMTASASRTIATGTVQSRQSNPDPKAHLNHPDQTCQSCSHQDRIQHSLIPR